MFGIECSAEIMFGMCLVRQAIFKEREREREKKTFKCPKNEYADIHFTYHIHMITALRLVKMPTNPLLLYTTCFDTSKLHILPTQCICVFHMVLTINSDCFPKQH
jgi:hypothetical protein